MFPLKDENPTELTPVVTYILIAINVVAWLLLQQGGGGEGFLQSLCTFGAIPADITGSLSAGQLLELALEAVCEVGGLAWMTIFTSMFMHGGWMHLIGNFWFLWVFGNNVEDSMGHIRYIIIIRIFMLPAWVLLIYWFAVQLLSGIGSLGAAEGGGVAFWAHIGGFVAGVALIKLFQRPQLVEAKRAHVKLSPDEIYRFRW